INDIIMIFAFAPITGFLLGIANIEIPWNTLILSVGLYVIMPLAAGVLTRLQLSRQSNPDVINEFLRRIKRLSSIGLLFTVVLLFGFQAEVILDKPEIIVLIAIPLILQTYGIFALGYTTAKFIRLNHSIAAPACLIGTSNFFELAVAVAISLFGLHSGAALATVVGVLVEVPVMLSLVYFANRTRNFFPA
ncbi:MAG: arsenical-resistance protein, partial [Chloroflexota bacterium]|nr:arsenical-resistance protein [Chloroflexota bacterium]